MSPTSSLSRKATSFVALCALAFSSLATAGPYRYVLPIGQADVGAQRITASPAVVQFPDIKFDTTAQEVLTLSNTSERAVEVGRISSTSPRFQVDTDCPAVLQGAQQCSVGLRFEPQTPGTYSGTIQVDSTLGRRIASAQVQGVATAGLLEGSLSAMAFSPVQVGEASDYREVVLRNTGQARVSGLRIASELLGSQFATQSTCAGGLAFQEECTVGVSFRPSVASNHVGTLRIESDAANPPVDIELSGSGQAPAAEFSLPTFPPVQVGQQATAFAVIRNIGVGQLAVNGVTVVQGAGLSASVAGCGVVAPGVACNVPVQFAPTQAGSVNGLIRINTAAGTYDASVAPVGAQGSLSIDGVAPTFSALLGGSPDVRQVVLRNGGTFPISLASVTSSNPEFFTSTGCQEIAVGASCAVSVAFAPTGSRGARTTTLTFAHDGAGTKVLALSGTATQGVLRLSQSNLNFGMAVGVPARTQTITATNDGDAPLSFNAIYPSHGEFTVSHTCSLVAPRASCTITVGATPSFMGVRSGSLTIAHNGSGTQSVAVSVEGQPAQPIAYLVGGASYFNKNPAYPLWGVCPSALGEGVSTVSRVLVRNDGNAPVYVTGISNTAYQWVFQSAQNVIQPGEQVGIEVVNSCQSVAGYPRGTLYTNGGAISF